MRIPLCWPLALLVFWSSFATLNAQTRSALDEVRSMPDDSAKVLAWIDMSRAYSKSDYPLSESLADSAIDLAQRIGFKKGEAKAYTLRGRAQFSQSQFDAAEESYGKALAYHQSMEETLEVARTLTNLGNIKRDRGDYEEAVSYFIKAMEIQELNGDTSGTANTYTNIAVVYAIRQDFDRALEYFNKALDIFRSTGDQTLENTILLNLGGISFESGDPEAALDYLNQALIFFREKGPLTELGRTYYVLGNVYLQTENLDSSEANYLRAKDIFDQIGSPMRSAGCLLRLSSVVEKRGDLDKAIRYAQQAEIMNEELGVMNMTARTQVQLSSLFEQKGNFKKALEYRKLYQATSDSLNNIDKTRQMEELEKKYQSELKERQLAKVQADLEVQELQVRRQKVSQRILWGVVLGGTFIFLLLWNQFRTKQKTNKLLKEKNEVIERSLHEKEILLREIHHRVKNNLQFLSSLFNLQARHVRDPQAIQLLQEGKNRIHSMALVHQKLYQEDDLTGVNMKDYLENLLDSLKHTYKASESGINVLSEIEPIQLDIDSAMPIGLIVNELITNAFKYAFTGRKSGSIEVQLKSDKTGILLTVSDDGIGIVPNEEGEDKDHFGLRLVRSLSEKLGGEPIV
ncbi:MAG: tetratricopeptide repeat protein, partial [Bacteroidota bacterium]|nr:tetratricopeptide repeat protein [Bacteroidota bacterium]